MVLTHNGTIFSVNFQNFDFLPFLQSTWYSSCYKYLFMYPVWELPCRVWWCGPLFTTCPLIGNTFSPAIYVQFVVIYSDSYALIVDDAFRLGFMDYLLNIICSTIFIGDCSRWVIRPTRDTSPFNSRVCSIVLLALISRHGTLEVWLRKFKFKPL